MNLFDHSRNGIAHHLPGPALSTAVPPSFVNRSINQTNNNRHQQEETLSAYLVNLHVTWIAHPTEAMVQNEAEILIIEKRRSISRTRGFLPWKPQKLQRKVKMNYLTSCGMLFRGYRKHADDRPSGRWLASTRGKCSASEKGRFFSLPWKTPEVVARWCDDACFISRPEGGGIPFLVSATNCCLPFCASCDAALWGYRVI